MILSFDSETHLIQKGCLAPPPVCWSFAWSETDDVALVNKETGARDLAYWLNFPSAVFVAHNAAFDFAVLCAHRQDLIPAVFQAYEDGRVRDTKIRAELLDIKDGRRQHNGMTQVLIGSEWKRADYSLAGLLMRYFEKDRFAEKEAQDAWRLRYASLEHLTIDEWPEAARKYAMEDATDTLAVHAHQQALAAKDNYTDEDLEGAIVNEREQVYAAFCLHLVACWGLRTDRAAVEELEARVTEEYRALQKRMFELGLYRVEKCGAEHVREGKVDFYDTFRRKVRASKAYVAAGNPYFTEDGKNYYWDVQENVPMRYVKNTAVIQDRVREAFAARGESPPETEKGAVKTDSDTLTLTGDDLLEELAENGPIGTIRRTFVPTLKMGTEVPINCRIQPLLNTGRPSAAAPNIFNLPRKGGVRECFVPRPDHVYCSVDYDCAELRSHAQVLLWLFGKSDLAEFFQKDPSGDPHLELAASILNITPEEAKKRKKAGDKEVSNVRQVAKPVNFGLPGGMGPDRLSESARKSYKINIPVPEARLRKQQWHARWSEMKWYFDWMTSRVGYGNGTLEQMRPGGKKHRRRGMVGFSDGCNTLFQGLTADGAKDALCRVMRECYSVPESPLYGCRVVVFLYDEIILEIPNRGREFVHAAAQRLATVMRDRMQTWLPDVPVTCAPALMTRWRKGAEAVFDQDGYLMPWEPAPEKPRELSSAA